jgi:hypothetical protein
MMEDNEHDDCDDMYEDLYNAAIKDTVFMPDEDGGCYESEEEAIEAVGNTFVDAPPREPLVLDLACGPESGDYEFHARTKVHDKIKFAYAETAGARLILRDGMVTGVDSDSRTFFDMLETDVDSLIWISAKRK